MYRQDTDLADDLFETACAINFTRAAEIRAQMLREAGLTRQEQAAYDAETGWLRAIERAEAEVD